MGWFIAELSNTVSITPACEADLRKLSLFQDYCSGVLEGKLNFNSDDMEHMDFVWQPEVLAVLARHRASGVVCFGSLEGDNAGEFWGYSFGGGEMKKMKGTLVWEPVLEDR